MKPSSSRNKQLDALRTLALLLVLGIHFGFLCGSKWIPMWTQMGWSGVDLFFVLSGFLISGLLFREYKSSGGVKVGRFLARRGLKIYPAYYLLMLGTGASFIILKTSWRLVPTAAWLRLLSDSLFIQNYTDGTWGHLWSMAVEEHFYIVLPIVLWLTIKFKRNNPFQYLPITAGIIIFLCLTFRTIPVLLGKAFIFPAASHLRFDGLAFGVLIAYCWEFRPEAITALLRNRGRWLLGCSAVLLLPQFLMLMEHPLMSTIGLTSTLLGYGGILIYSLKCVNGENVVIRQMAKIGAYSYTIYLVHLPILYICNNSWHPDNWFALNVKFLVYMALSGGVGILFAKLVELPILRLRNRLWPMVPRIVAPLPAAA